MAGRKTSGVAEERAGFGGLAVGPADGAGPAERGGDWVHKLIAMTRPGVEIEFPERSLGERPVPFEYDDFS